MSRINNKFFLATLIISSLFLLIACGKDERTAEELIRYHNENWKELSGVRDEILAGNSSELVYIEETEGKQASEAYLEDVILSELEIFIEEEKEIDIQDDSVKKLHELLIAADEFAYNSLKDNATAYYRHEIDGDEFRERTKETKKPYDDFFDHREKLMKKNNVVFDQVINEQGSYEERMVHKSEAKNNNTIIWGEG